MVNYRYHLDKKPRKYICPECGKKSFTPYVDDWGEPVDVELYGRCDRENNCGYIKYPKGDQYAPSFDDLHRTRETKPKQITYLQQKHVSHTENPTDRAKNPLFQFLTGVFGYDVVASAWERYHVGTNTKNPTFTCWWQIDNDGRVHTGHFMQYRPDGHRNKENPYSQTWAHALLKRAKQLDEQAEVEQCLFGLHLLGEPGADEKPVYLFESEKTALVASIVHPDVICMATSGCSSFSSSKLKALHGRHVVYFPDDDTAGGKWNAQTAIEQCERCGLASLTRNWWTCGITYDYTPRTGLDYCDHVLNLMQADVVPEPPKEPDTAANIEPPEPTHLVSEENRATTDVPTGKDLLRAVVDGLTFKVTGVSISASENLPFEELTDDVPF